MINNLSTFSNTLSNEIATFGRAALAAKFPDDFEYYGMQFELQNSQGVVKDSLYFPIMPNQISETCTDLVNIKKSSTSVVVLTNTTFPIRQISIGGTFGRKAKILIVDLPNKNKSSLNVGARPQFSTKIKTGFGLLKVLERIIKQSVSVDEYGQPHFLFLYNFALGNNYLVEVCDYSFNMSMENNMLWNYQLNLKATATAEQANSRTGGGNSLMKRMMIDAINKSVNRLVSNLTNMNQTQASLINSYTLLKRKK
jgi:hypothetical protein